VRLSRFFAGLSSASLSDRLSLAMQERLQKIIAAAGLASRRGAEQLILDGLVTVNGQVVRQLGSKADPARDFVKVRGKRLQPEPLEHFAVYKPPGVVSSVSDPKNRPVVTDLVHSSRRLYPAGRLDFFSEGLMILSNDGEQTRKLTRAGGLEKVYRVKVQGIPVQRKLDVLRKGMRLGSEKLAPCRIRNLKKGKNCWFEVGLRQGRNRQIRRMFEKIGHPVMRLRRVSIGPVTLGNLKPGAARPLTGKELEALKGEARERSRFERSGLVSLRTKPRQRARKGS